MDPSFGQGPTSFSPPGTPPPAASVSQESIRLLAATKPWVRFLSVLFFVVIGLCTLGALIFLTLGSLDAGSSSGMGLGVVELLVVIIVLIAIYLYPAITLYRYASAIRLLVETRQVGALEQALARQKSFWKFAGIFVLILLCFYVMIGIIAVLSIPGRM